MSIARPSPWHPFLQLYVPRWPIHSSVSNHSAAKLSLKNFSETFHSISLSRNPEVVLTFCCTQLLPFQYLSGMAWMESKVTSLAMPQFVSGLLLHMAIGSPPARTPARAPIRFRRVPPERGTAP